MFLNIIDNIIEFYINNLITTLNKNNNININKYIKDLSFDKIKDIIKDDNNVNIIKNIIIKYIYIYNLLHNNYDNTKDNINKILLSEMKNNKYIDNNIINSVNTLIDIKSDLIELKKNNYNKELKVYINLDFIKNFVEIYKNINITKENMIKTILYIGLYFQYDKYIIYEIIEKQIVKYNNFKYIEIINNNDINYTYDKIYNMIYNYNNFNKNDVDIIYNLLNNDDKNKYYSIDIINHMFNNFALFPITDEILLINKNNIYFIKKKELNINNNIAINSLLTLYNNAIKYYDLDNKYEDIFDKNKVLKGININVNEQILMISKIIKFTNLNLDTNNLYNDLYSYKFNPYLNFIISNTNTNKYNNISFNHSFKNMIRAVRLSNIEFKNQEQLYVRNIGENIDANIVGFILVPNNCIQYKSLLYNGSKLKKLDINNVYNVLKTLNKSKKKYLYYYLFDKSKYSNIESNTIIQSNIKNDVNKVFSIIQKYIFKYTKKIIKNADSMNIVKYFNNNSFNLNLKKLYIILNDNNYIIEIIDNNYIIEINKRIFTKVTSFNINDHTFVIKDKKIIIPTIKNTDKNKIVIKKSNNVINNDDLVCYHNIYYKYIEQYRKDNNLEKYYEKLNEYILKFGIDTNYGELICKSCKSILFIKKYSTFTYNQNDGVISYNYVLDDKEKYDNYKSYIDIIDSILRKLCSICNINFLLQFENKKFRQELSYLVIDIIIVLYDFYKLYPKYKEKKIFNITESKFTLFNIKDKFNEKTEHWNIIYNNIVIITTFVFILQINSSNINNLPFNKKYNYTIFNLHSKLFFNNINIISDKNKTLNLIHNYKVLSYIIYYISNSCIKYNLWYNFKFDKNQDNLNIKIFIETLLDFINFILSYNIKNQNINNSINKFIHYFNTIFNNPSIIYNLHNKEINKIYISDGKIIIKNSSNIYNDILLSFTNTVGNIDYINKKVLYNYYNKISYKTNLYKLSPNDLNILYKKLININNNNIFNNYDINGIKNKQNNNTYDDKIFNKIINIIYKNKLNLNYYLNIKISKILKKNKKVQTSINSFTSKILNLNNHIDDFINIVSSNLSNEFNIGVYNIDIKNNTYYISKDQFNNNINLHIKEENIRINQKVFEIVYKKIILYYDYHFLNLIKYKNNNDEMTFITSGSNIIDINYSIIKKINYIGFDKRFYDILDIKDYYNIIISRYNNIINFIDTFIETVTKINNNTITGTYKELFSDIKINIDNIHKIKKIKNINFNHNNFTFSDFGNNIYIEKINNIQLINNIINYIIKFFINMYEINNKNNKILSFIIFYINHSVNKQFNFMLNYDKKNIIFNNLLCYNQYFDDLADTLYIEIPNNDKYQLLQDILDIKNNDDISENELDNDYNLDIDYDKEDHDEDIDDQFIFKVDD